MIPLPIFFTSRPAGSTAPLCTHHGSPRKPANARFFSSFEATTYEKESLLFFPYMVKVPVAHGRTERDYLPNIDPAAPDLRLSRARTRRNNNESPSKAGRNRRLHPGRNVPLRHSSLSPGSASACLATRRQNIIDCASGGRQGGAS
ncbi:hypothetical protein VTI28DRAFT_7838 [Corynascus sepedonium]